MSSELKWYVLHSHPRREEALYQHVLSQGFDCYYPIIKVHPVNPRSRKTQPYFPGYIFVHVDLKSIGDSVFKWMPYSTGLVTFGGEPATIHDAIVDTISLFVAKINSNEFSAVNGLKSGDKVEIHSGLFKGYDAIFDMQISGSQRVRILLKMLTQDRIVPIVLPANQIKSKAKE